MSFMQTFPQHKQSSVRFAQRWSCESFCVCSESHIVFVLVQHGEWWRVSFCVDSLQGNFFLQNANWHSKFNPKMCKHYRYLEHSVQLYQQIGTSFCKLWTDILNSILKCANITVTLNILYSCTKKEVPKANAIHPKSTVSEYLLSMCIIWLKLKDAEVNVQCIVHV